MAQREAEHHEELQLVTEGSDQSSAADRSRDEAVSDPDAASGDVANGAAAQSPSPQTQAEISAWADRLISGERRALARAITLVESRRADHRAQADLLLDTLRERRRATGVSTAEGLRIGLSGTPGVGKSTFIEAFGGLLTQKGERVAVLAVDPSSARTGGSILGDKTRMECLSRDPNAFIRPSPSEGALGGVARRTRECIELCEAAGFGVTIVETVGVGQSETMVAEMTDVFVLLLAPAGGDELQGVKRGVMEMADVVLVNKADGELRSAAMRTVADYRSALALFRKRPSDPDGVPCVLPVSAATGEGLPDALDRIVALNVWRRDEGWKLKLRRAQALTAMHQSIERRLRMAFEASPDVQDALAAASDAVIKGALPPEIAADRVVRAFWRSEPEPDEQ